MKTPTLRLCAVTLMFLTAVVACKKNDVPVTDNSELTSPKLASAELNLYGDAFVPVSWFQLQLKLIKESPGFSPPVAARAIAYTGVTLHEAAGRIKGLPTLSGQLDGLSSLPSPERGKSYNAAIAANSAMAAIIKNLFGNISSGNLALVNQLESDNLQALSGNCQSTEINRSIAFGRAIASAINQWSATDGGKDGYLNNFPADYIPPVGPGLWIPTPPAFQRAMLPYWGNNRLLVRPLSGTLTPPPPAYATDTNSALYKASFQVYHAVNTLTPEQRTIALYWADGGGTFTPPGHLIAITAQLVSEQHLSLSEAAKLFAQVGIGLNDAGIVCWKNKYHYNLLRPITYIHANIDSAWTALIATPPFPSYTSGHATFTAATGHILAAKFGSSFSFSDKQKVPEGFAARSFNNFTEMINEAAISRVYGGIHYEFDSEAGKVSGKDVADRVTGLNY